MRRQKNGMEAADRCLCGEQKYDLPPSPSALSLYHKEHNNTCIKTDCNQFKDSSLLSTLLFLLLLRLGLLSLYLPFFFFLTQRGATILLRFSRRFNPPRKSAVRLKKKKKKKGKIWSLCYARNTLSFIHSRSVDCTET